MRRESYKESKGNIDIEVAFAGYNFSGEYIRNILTVMDNERGIEGDLLFDSEGRVLQANHRGRDGIYGDVPLKSWIRCYNEPIKGIMSEEAQAKYFPEKLPFRETPLLGEMLLADNGIILGEEEIVDFEDDDW
jgi:hypothetical protein